MDLTLHHLGTLPSSARLPPASPSGILALTPSAGLSVLAPAAALRTAPPPPPLAGRVTGSAVAHDAAAAVVYCALAGADAGAVAVLDVGAAARPGAAAPAVRVIECFERRRGAVAALAGIGGVGATGEVVVAVSQRGTVALLRARADEGGRGSVEVFRGVADLNVGEVLGVDAGVPGCVGVLGVRGKRLGIHVIHVASGPDGAGIEADLFDVAWCPQRPRAGAAVLGFAVAEAAAWVLYEGGVLHCFWPRFGAGGGGGGLDAWRLSYDRSPPLRDGAGEAPAGATPPRTPREARAAAGECETPGKSGRRPKGRGRMDRNPAAGEDAAPEAETADVVGDDAAAPDEEDGDQQQQQRKKPQKGHLAYQYKAKFTMSLLPRADTSSSPAAPAAATPASSLRGGVASIGGGYVVVGYGRVVSVWDGQYGTGHGFLEMPEDIAGVARGAADGEAVVMVAGGDVYSITTGPDDVAEPVTIGLAVKRQAACRAIVASVARGDDAGRAPLHAQPVAVAALRAAADAGGAAAGQLLASHIKAEEREDELRLRRVLDASAGADKVAEAFELYVFGSRKGRLAREALAATGKARRDAVRGVADRQMGLERLPSERLAAAVVARCLREVDAGRTEFLVPLVDMVFSGVVSADLVLAVMAGLEVAGDASAGTGPAVMTGALTRSIETSYALEALLMRVVDMPELDVVRAAQFAVRVREQALGVAEEAGAVLAAAGGAGKWLGKERRKKKKKNGKQSENKKDGERPESLVSEARRADMARRKSDSERNRAKKAAAATEAVSMRKQAQARQTRTERLLARCVAAPMDADRFVAALHRMPPHDVFALLRYCNTALTRYDFAAQATLVASKGARQSAARQAAGAAVVGAGAGAGAGAADGTKGGKGREGVEGGDAPVRNVKWGRPVPPSPTDYLGDCEWLCASLYEGLMREEAVSKFQAQCGEWVSRILETHMTTLVMDDVGSELLAQLLATVRSHRLRAEAVSPLLGMVSHLRDQRPLPDSSDPLYSMARVQVPSFAALC